MIRQAIFTTKRRSTWLRQSSLLTRQLTRESNYNRALATSSSSLTPSPSSSSPRLPQLLLRRPPVTSLSSSIGRVVIVGRIGGSNVSQFASFATASSTKKRVEGNNKKDQGSLYFVKAGLPLLLFSILGAWVVSNGIEGKNKERDAFQGRMSK